MLLSPQHRKVKPKPDSFKPAILFNDTQEVKVLDAKRLSVKQPLDLTSVNNFLLFETRGVASC